MENGKFKMNIYIRVWNLKETLKIGLNVMELNGKTKTRTTKTFQ